MGKLFKFLLACLLVSMTAFVLANDVPPAAGNPALEKRVQALAEELRCLVCQNQTIADSNAELAIDLKNKVREMLAQGMSEQEVIAYMVQRYGDFVLYRPPVKSSTWLLWFGPFLLLTGGIGVLGLKLRNRKQPEALPESELQRAADLLHTPTEPKDAK